MTFFIADHDIPDTPAKASIKPFSLSRKNLYDLIFALEMDDPWIDLSNLPEDLQVEILSREPTVYTALPFISKGIKKNIINLSTEN